MRKLCLLLLSLTLASGACASLPQSGVPGSPAGGPGEMGGPPNGRSSFARQRMFLMGPPGRWWDDSRVAQQLALTADQRSKMDDIFASHRPELIDDMGAVQKAESALEPLFAADAPNESAIVAQIGKVAEARAELEKAHARMLLALRRQITHDQWVKLQAMRPAQMHEGWRNRNGEMPGPPPDGGAQPPRQPEGREP